MGYTTVVVGDKHVTVHQTLYAKLLSIAFALSRLPSCSNANATDWNELIECINEHDEMGNGVMELPLCDWNATGKLSFADLLGSLERAQLWLEAQSETITSNHLSELGVPPLYVENALRDRLLEVCHKLQNLLIGNQ